ncbi:hypothetical protein ACH5RR_041131 [Cinchona calisaya]|uniref:Uncharacterized protein n=1 Tax=Cinchona calisaya TaxID=153742 RepID=A0ABD2XVW7_9GENT
MLRARLNELERTKERLKQELRLESYLLYNEFFLCQKLQDKFDRLRATHMIKVHEICHELEILYVIIEEEKINTIEVTNEIGEQGQEAGHLDEEENSEVGPIHVS